MTAGGLFHLPQLQVAAAVYVDIAGEAVELKVVCAVGAVAGDGEAELLLASEEAAAWQTRSWVCNRKRMLLQTISS